MNPTAGDKKTVVITGVTRGIGRGLLEQLAKMDQFDKIVGICREGSPQLNELKTQFKGSSKVHLFGADVTNLTSFNSIASQLKTQNIQPDMVIANAGVFTAPKPVWEITESELTDNFDTNIKGVLNTMKTFIPLLKDRKNSVMMTISSDWGTCGHKGFGAHCMSKFAVEGLTQAAGQDTKTDQITVVSVNPGLVYSNMLVEAFGETEAKKIGAPVEKFVPHFVNKMMGITKQMNGQHLDFSLEGSTAGRIAAEFIEATHVEGDDIAQLNQNHEVQEDLNATTTSPPPAFVAQQTNDEINDLLASLLDSHLHLATNQEVANLLHLEDFDSSSADDDDHHAHDFEHYDASDYDGNHEDDDDEYEYNDDAAGSDEENEDAEGETEEEYTTTSPPPNTRSGIVTGWVV